MAPDSDYGGGFWGILFLAQYADAYCVLRKGMGNVKWGRAGGAYFSSVNRAERKRTLLVDRMDLVWAVIQKGAARTPPI
jgi:hypothetical protein